MIYFRDITKNFVKGILIFFITVYAVYSQNSDVYGSYDVNNVLMNLGGAGKYAAVPHSFVLNHGFQGTVEAWVYLSSLNINNTCILEKGPSFMFGVGTAFVFNRPILRVNGVVLFPQTGDAVPLNRWVHLAVTWQQTGPAVIAVFYVDGNIIGSHTQNVNLSNNNDSLTIGGSRIQTNSFVNGYVDEVRYWNRLRTGIEIARNRFCGIGDGTVANQNAAITSAEDYLGLVSSWTFNEEGGSMVWDYISLQHGFTRGGVTKGVSNIPGQPVPYNLAAYFQGGANDYIRVPDNSNFDRVTSGSIDAWINTTTSGNHAVVSKGSTSATTTFSVNTDNLNRLSIRIGGFDAVGPVIPINIWNHIAVTWRSNGGSYSIRFYLNGNLATVSTINASMPVNADPVIIGNWQALNLPFAGYMDELRMWGRDLSADEVRAYMFASVKSGGQFFQNNLVASWSFEGNLNNSTQVAEINGTFNTGSLNKCRFSGFSNENITAPPGGQFNPHITAINRLEGHPFPGGYSIRTPDKSLLFNTLVYDTIFIPGNIPLTNIELFLSAYQENIHSLTVTLRAPNGVERTVLASSGGIGGNVLTFFKDGSLPLTAFTNPWSHLAAPIQAFGNFSNANSGGNWILRLSNGGSTTAGKLLGWGLRINNSITGIEPISNIIPSVFKLHQNYPNPFNPSTNIRFDISVDANVKIIIYDLLGRQVQVLTDEYRFAGSYEVRFDASALSSGMYFYRLRAGSFTDIKKMVLIK